MLPIWQKEYICKVSIKLDNVNSYFIYYNRRWVLDVQVTHTAAIHISAVVPKSTLCILMVLINDYNSEYLPKGKEVSKPNSYPLQEDSIKLQSLQAIIATRHLLHMDFPKQELERKESKLKGENHRRNRSPSHMGLTFHRADVKNIRAYREGKKGSQKVRWSQRKKPK